MDIKMLGFDMDGTLLDSHSEFPERNCRVLRECERRGIRLVFCSGRNFETLRAFARRVGVNPILAAANGARIDASIDGPTLLERAYDDAHSEAVYRAMLAAKIYFIAFTRGHSYMTHAEYRVGRHCRHVKATTDEPIDGLPYEQVVDDERARLEGTVHPYKYVACGVMNDPRFEIIDERIRHLGMSVSSSAGDNMEVMMPGVDKGSAMRWIAEREGIPASQVMVFGDHTNDAPMLRYAGWPVVMANGADEVKPLARIIAPGNDEAGVAQVIERYVLGENTERTR